MRNLEERLLMAASILNGKTKSEKKMQYALIQQMVQQFQNNRQVDEDLFELVVEEASTGKAFPLRKAKKLLELTGVFVCGTDGIWDYNTDFYGDGEELEWEELKGLFSGNSLFSDELSEGVCKNAIIRGISWMLNMVFEAKNDGHIEGLPAFYSCDGEKDHIIGYNVAGTSTSDVLAFICQSPEYLKECGLNQDELKDCFEFLLDKILKCQCRSSGWDFGGFYPYEDQPESEHPTVDATCLAIMALGAFYENKESIEKESEIELSIEIQNVEETILSGIEFLFRMQLKDGSFGIYHYQNDTPETKPNENCTRMVQSALGVSKGCGIFDQEDRDFYYPRCNAIIEKTYRYLKNHRTEDSDGPHIWSPYFGKNATDYRPEDNIVSTARVCRSFIPVWWQMKEERESILQYHRDFLVYWRNHAKKAHDNVGLYRFNSPMEKMYSVGEYQWNSRPDILAAFSIIQAYNQFKMVVDLNDWHLIEDAVNHTIQLQHSHGHWDNPIGDRTPFCAVTLAAIELIEEYRKARYGN